MKPPLILQAFRQPDALTTFSLLDWDMLLRQARKGNLLVRLYTLLQERDLLQQVPPQPREQLEWSQAVAERHRQSVHWEVKQIQKALSQVDAPVVLLKGAAYVLAGLPAARGRIFTDIDILVPKASINQVEAALMLHGWMSTHHDAYDQRYYRTWMHELPPMQNIRRGTVIDVHHAILPETAYIHPDSSKLLAAAQDLPGYEGFKVLAPSDMVLHSAVHLFHEGELDNGLRDLTDIDSLLRHFSSHVAFWPELIERAQVLELSRPLFYALRYCSHLLHTPVPLSAIEAAEIAKPNRFTLALMDALYSRALLPMHPSCSDWCTDTARRLLYLRANWLRMPPLLLARHLFHKAFISPKEE
ncbi:MAG: nucleotidyltransferase family protein [Methylophilaceae bacterium]|nr:nucleotidyltransferase family protein [Methylophilaceae bacterium]